MKFWICFTNGWNGRQRVSEAIRRLKERGVDEQVIRECLKDL